MGLKKSVMLNDYSVGVLERRYREFDDINYSQGINESISIAQWLASELLPELTPGEWEIILNTYAGCIVDHRMSYRIASDIMDGRGIIEMSELERPARELVQKTHKMSQPEQYAVIEFVRHFWNNEWAGLKDALGEFKKTTR